MRRIPNALSLTLLLLIPLLVTPAPVAAEDPPDEPEAAAAPENSEPIGWPREIETENGTLVIYQPQIDTLEGNTIDSRAAISFTPTGGEPVFGAAWFKARFETDRENRMAYLVDIAVPSAKFPNSTPEKVAKLEAVVQKDFLKAPLHLSLDRLLTSIETAEKAKIADSGMKSDPPKVLFTTYPALLVTIDGEPRLQKVEGTSVMRVVNTPFYMLYDTKGPKYYLNGGGSWLSSVEIKGPWQDAKTVPPEVKATAAADPEAPKPDPEQEPVGMPKIIVATEPTELIQTDGKPEYKPIDGTGLLHLVNTESDVYLTVETQVYYVLLSGRWFASKKLTAGEWKSVSQSEMPDDFKKIPANDDTMRVRASVAGTDEANEAVLDTYIPQTAAVERSKATLEVTYDGDPEFEKVENSTLEYAVNSPFAVFKVGALYYCCNDAVWFVAETPTGVWVICDDVPDEIYAIPPSNPNYNVKYVEVYESTPEVVYVGYTPGYMGCYRYHGVVWWGTGWWYRPWWRTWYYPRPCTWGFGFRYNPWRGGWGVGIGWRGPRGWVGIGVGRGGGAWIGGGIRVGVGVGVGVGVARRGWWGAGGFRRNNVNINVDRSINVGDVNIGNRGGNNLYDRRNDVAKTRDRNPGRDRPGVGTRDRPAAGTRDRPAAGTRDRSAARSNNVFTDKNGDVYRKTDSGWQTRKNGNWSEYKPKTAADRPATRDRPAAGSGTTRDRPSAGRTGSGGATSRPAATRQRTSTQSLNRSYSQRQRGTTRTNSYRSYSGSRSYGGSRGGGYRGGGSRGGGGGRRR